MNIEPHFSHLGSTIHPQSPTSDPYPPPRAARADAHGDGQHHLGGSTYGYLGTANHLRSGLCVAPRRPDRSGGDMANEVRLTRRFPDGDTVYITVRATSAYADALDEARAVVIRTYADYMNVTLTADEAALADHAGDDDDVFGG